MRSLVAVMLVGTLLGAQAAASRESGTRSSAAAGGPVKTADASAAADAETQALRNDLQEIINRPRWNGDRWSVMVVSLDQGDTIFSLGGTEQLAPASNMKLFTTAAALYYLGPDFRYNTFLMATGPIANGVLEGDLIVYGTGDPTFSGRFGNALAVWQAFADTLSALGVREIRGRVVGDGSYFTGAGAGEGWQQSYMNASYAANAGALSYAENVAMLQIRPAAQAGWRPEVTLVPGGEGIAIVNQATTVAGRGTRIDAQRTAYDGPIVVRGQIARGAAPVLRSVPVSDPARFAAAVMREVLTRQQITVHGGVASAMTEGDSPVTGRAVFAPALDSQAPVRVLAVHTSRPLIDILTIINKKSHNLMAEQVLRTVGRVAAGMGSVQGGRRAIEHMLEQEGQLRDFAIYDGSGLSVLNRSSARGFIALLTLMAGSPMWEQYWATLPEAGAPDGLRRMYRTGAERNLRAKTGTIDRVSALSGYVTSANGERLAFSIISNNVPSTWMAKRVEDAIGARLASLRRPFTPAAAAGQPATPPGAAPAPAQPPAPPPVTPAPGQPAQPAAPSGTQPHTIRRGETLSHLARQYAVTVAEIQAVNPGLNPRRIQAGQTVMVPVRASGPTPPPVRRPTSGGAAAPAGGQRSHTIRSGETLDGIARRYGTSVRALQQANPGLDPRRLRPGRSIKVPQ